MSLHPANGKADGPAPSPHLDPREAAVLRALADGLGIAEAAAALSIGVGDARVHLRAAMGRLDADSAIHALIVAYRTGLIDPTDESWPAGETASPGARGE